MAVRIDQDLDATLALKTVPGEHATDLRQSLQFAEMLANDERPDFVEAGRAGNLRVH